MRRIILPFIIAIPLITSCSQQTAISSLPTETAVPTATLLSTPTIIPTPFPNALYVDPNISLGEISPLVYGSNYGPWLVVSLDMLPAAYDSGITVMRFPAGSWGDHNDVKEFQIDQFMDFFKKVGATAMFNVRLLNEERQRRWAKIELCRDVRNA